jgi:ElaB/YqjD/DUF883 family membrane-anchored ribosome-binding protein
MLENIEEQAKEKIREGMRHIKEETGHLSEKAREGARVAREKALHYREDAKEFLDDASEYIKKNPQQSTLIAAGVGALAGIIIGLLIRGNRHN